MYLNHLANKSNNQEICCSKTCISRVLSAPNFYCCNFNGRAVPWVSPFEFVCKSRVESRAQCVTNGAENSTSQLRINCLSSTKLRVHIKKHNRFFSHKSVRVKRARFRKSEKVFKESQRTSEIITLSKIWLCLGVRTCETHR